MLCWTDAGEQVDITDPAILSLVSELGLVPGVPPPFRYTPDLFCDRYHQFLAEKKREQERLKVALYKRNKKYSTFGRIMYQDIVVEYKLF